MLLSSQIATQRPRRGHTAAMASSRGWAMMCMFACLTRSKREHGRHFSLLRLASLAGFPSPLAEMRCMHPQLRTYNVHSRGWKSSQIPTPADVNMLYLSIRRTCSIQQHNHSCGTRVTNAPTTFHFKPNNRMYLFVGTMAQTHGYAAWGLSI